MQSSDSELVIIFFQFPLAILNLKLFFSGELITKTLFLIYHKSLRLLSDEIVKFNISMNSRY